MSVRQFRAGFCITSVGKHHETSDELSILSGDRIRASKFTVRARAVVGRSRAQRRKPSKSPRSSSVRVLCAGFCITCIDMYHATSADLSISSGDCNRASRSVPYGLVRCSRPETTKPSKSALHTSVGVDRAGFCITSIYSHRKTSAELPRL